MRAQKKAIRQAELDVANARTRLAHKVLSLPCFPESPLHCPKCGADIQKAIYHEVEEPRYHIAGVVFGEAIVYQFPGDYEHLTWVCDCGWSCVTATKEAQ